MRPARVGVSTTGAIKLAMFVDGSIKPCASVVKQLCYRGGSLSPTSASFLAVQTISYSLYDSLIFP